MWQDVWRLKWSHGRPPSNRSVVATWRSPERALLSPREASSFNLHVYKPITRLVGERLLRTAWLLARITTIPRLWVDGLLGESTAWSALSSVHYLSSTAARQNHRTGQPTTEQRFGCFSLKIHYVTHVPTHAPKCLQPRWPPWEPGPSMNVTEGSEGTTG